jgi:hypothetical protein
MFVAAGLAVLVWLPFGGTAFAAAPANDNFANAAPLSGLPASATGTNVDATTESGEPEPWSNAPGGHSVWWKWTAPADGDVTVDTCGSVFDTLLAVYTGDSVAALTPVASNDFGGCGTDGSNSKLYFTAQSGHVYRIAVDGPSYCPGSPCPPIEGRVGSIALAIKESPQPANDDFADAAVLTESEYETAHGNGTNAGASKETGEPGHAGGAGGRSVWWSWTAPRNGAVYFDMCGSDFDPLFAVYTGVAVDALTEVTSVAGSDCRSTVRSTVSFRARAGVTYHIAVDGAAGSIGDFYLQKRPTPSNDDFENATPLSGLTASDHGLYGFGYGGTSEPGEPNHAGNAGGHSLWWRWTAPADGPVQIDTCSSYPPGLDSVVAVHTGDAVHALSLVASNDNLASCAPGAGVVFTATAGRTYRIAVDDAAGSNAYGYIGLSIEAVPQPPSNEFSFGKVEKNKGTGAARLTVAVPGPGKLDVAETDRVEANAKRAGHATEKPLIVRARGRAKQKLNADGRATVNPKVTFTPTGGSPNTKRIELKLIKR